MELKQLILLAAIQAKAFLLLGAYLPRQPLRFSK